jgi:hypothetical protein
MNVPPRLALAIAAATVMMIALSPITVLADDTQNQKNNWRNAAIAGGAVTLYGLVNHQHTTALLGAVGTGIALSQYERKRHEQSERNSERARYYHHHHHYRHHRYH